MKTIINLNGRWKDQRGKARRGKITGYNSKGIACREYTWIDPVVPELKGKTFEAFDSQINFAKRR